MVKEARPDELTGSSRDLSAVVTQFKDDLQRIQAEMQGVGEPWGGDLLGMLIGEAHGIGFETIFELYGELGDTMDEDAEDLDRLAVNHWDAETKSNATLTNVGNELV